MAEEEKAEPETDGKKKGKLMPLILVAVGAALGGGGVVLTTKPALEQGKDDNRPSKLIIVHQPDEMSFTFNPITNKGMKTARVRLKFDYQVDENFKDGAEEAIREKWDLAYSRCNEVMMQQKSEVLKTPEGKRSLKRLLVDELTLAFFPEDSKGERIAIVKDVLWMEFFIQ